MDKVFIVTSGWYSDYRIERVFTDRAKAEAYKNALSDANDIETFPIDDNIEYEEYNFVRIQCNFDDKGNVNLADYKEGFYFQFSNDNTLDSPIEPITEDRVSPEYLYCRSGRLLLGRVVRKANLTPYEKEDIKNKYKKVCYDLIKQVVYLKNVQNMDDQQIQQALGGK